MITNQHIIGGSTCPNDIEIIALTSTGNLAVMPAKVPKKLGRPPKNDDSWKPDKNTESKIKNAHNKCLQGKSTTAPKNGQSQILTEVEE